jgi:hypothetical protein
MTYSEIFFFDASAANFPMRNYMPSNFVSRHEPLKQRRWSFLKMQCLGDSEERTAMLEIVVFQPCIGVVAAPYSAFVGSCSLFT